MKKQPYLQNSENFSLPGSSSFNTGSPIMKQAILNLIVTTAQQQVKESKCIYRKFTNLLEPVYQWKHGHYRNLSSMLDIPINTLKYYITEGTGLKMHNRQKIMAFLGYHNWAEVEHAALMQVLKKGLSD